MLLKKWRNDEIKEEVRKYLKTNDNEIQLYKLYKLQQKLF